MGQEQTPPRLIAEKKIGDSILVSIYDRSRLVAGDRWQVGLVCEVKVPAAEQYWPQGGDETPEITDCIRREIGAVLIYSAEKTRNFIDQHDKDALIAQMLGQLEENVVHYVSKPDFARKLFARHYRLAREKCLLAHYQRQQAEQAEEEEDEGPADFSHLFK